MSDQISVDVTGHSKSPKRMRIENGDEEFVVGREAGPLGHLLAALAGCVNSTGHQVARDMGLDVEDLTVTVEGEYDPAAYLGEDTDAPAGFEDLSVDVEVVADADEATLQEWLDDVKRRCPVSDTLAGETPVALDLSAE